MKKEHPGLEKVIAGVLIVGQVVLYAPPVGAAAATQAAQERGSSRGEERRVDVNRTPPHVDAPPRHPVFSEYPTDDEIFRARVFVEPLVAIGATKPEENAALARALMAYIQGGAGERVDPLVAFLEGRHLSPWRASLQLNVGITYRRTGYFTRALRSWEEAWAIARTSSTPRSKAVADRAAGELAQLYSRLGEQTRLAELFTEIEGRDIGGSAGEMIAGAKQGLWRMRHQPERSFRCGPLALDRILASAKPGYRGEPELHTYPSTVHGTTLLEMRDLANKYGMGFQMARRVDLAAEVLVPALVHWEAGHFAALVKAENGRYLVQDPTFGEELWVSQRAFDDQASGYMLVREGPLPRGWRALRDAEGERIWGKGATQENDVQNQDCGAQQHGGCGGSYCRKDCPCKKASGQAPAGDPLASYAFHTMLVNLNISDVPVGYSAPRGSAVGFAVTYNQREVFLPQIPTYGNVGPKWNFGWLSFIDDDPVTPSQPVNLYLRGGGQETYTGYDSGTQSYDHHERSRAYVVRVSEDPIRYERRMGDGSVDVYEQPDGALTFPRKVFLTESIDPQGETVTFTYDVNLRLVAVTDAVGQVTTLSYELPGDSLKITKVTDPFGRFATLEYDGFGRLLRITDLIGLTSEFAYGAGDFITSLTTPYGTTTFAAFDEGRRRWLEATDPHGGKERLEYLNWTGDGLAGADANAFPYGLPSNEYPVGINLGATPNLWYRNTFYWNKEASALYPGDYTKAKLIHWLHTPGLTQTAGVIENEKEPLESTRTFYKYPNMGWQSTGSHASPSYIGKVMDDGSSQVREFEYNASGKTTKSIDPLGRETVYVYGTGTTPDANQTTGIGIDLLEVKQNNGSGYDTLWSAAYNSQHLPLSVTDAAGKTTTYTYNAAGQVLTATTPERDGITENRTTTYVYDTDGYLQSITGPATGSTTTFTYDGYGRVETVTSSDNDTVTYEYDALGRPTKVTYPDGTYEETVYERLDPVRRRDRMGRWTETSYDALRRVVGTRDAEGRTTSYLWCDCGSLSAIVDPNGNTTSWDRDAQGRVIREKRNDASFFEYSYESATSRLKETKDAEGQITQYAYNLDDTLAQVSYPNATITTPTVTFAYDTAYNRLTSMTDGTGATGYTYQAPGDPGAGRLATVDGPLADDTLSYTYDELGRVVSRGLAAFSTSAAYDVVGRLTTVGSSVGSFTYGYDGVTSRPLSFTYPNSQETLYSYFGGTGDRRLQQIQHKAPGGAVLSQFDYTYDAGGSIETWQQKLETNPARVFDLGYDRVDQLTAATLQTTDPTPTVLKRYAYAYDPSGNRTAEQVDDAVVGATYNGRNQLVSQQPGGALRFQGSVSEEAKVSVAGKPAEVRADETFEGQADVPSGTSQVEVRAEDYSGNVRTSTYEVSQSGSTTSYTYDSNGSLTGDGTRTYEWDGANRLVSVKEGTTTLASFVYDGQGRRAQKTAGGVTHTYIYDGEDILEERLSTGPVYRYVHGPGIDQPLARVVSGSVQAYYLADHLGSIVQETSSAGAVTLTREYDPYGNLIQGSGTGGYAYTAREWDPEIGLYYYRARYYDPKIGRFLSEDPIGWFGGVNFYAYALSNPVKRKDPYGLDWRDAAREAQQGWPFDPWAPRTEGFDRWPNPPRGPTRDRQRHCYYACIQMRRNGPMFAWWIPFDFVRQFGGAFLGQRSWGEAAGDVVADWWGGMWAFDPTKTCEEQCNVCPTNK